MRALRALLAALSYFTILPVARFAPDAAPDALVLSFLPVVGAIVGAVAGYAGLGVWLLTHSVLWCALAAWIASIVLSGAIHLDGFLDCCDGVFAAVPVQRRLEILRDPNHGTFALAGMAMLSAVWIGALYAITPAMLPLVLAFSGSLARLGAMLNAWIFPYARTAVTAAFVATPSLAITAAGAIVVAVLAWAIAPPALAVVPGAALFAIGLAWLCARRLGGGLTGDVYGAVVVASELFVLIVVRACAIVR